MNTIKTSEGAELPLLRLHTGNPENTVRFPLEKQTLFFTTLFNRLCGQPIIQWNDFRDIFPGGKKAGK
jgi:hypothetical protein